MKDERVVLNTDADAANVQTVTGWVSRTGHFFGKDERAARYDGSTHVVCDGCGNVRPKSSYCDPCHQANAAKKFAAMPRKVWDGVGMLYSDSADRYFFAIEDAAEYAYDEDTDLASLHLIICEPQYAREIDPNEYYGDELPEDGEVDGELADAFEELNKLIRESKPILSLMPGKFAAEV